MGIEAKRYVVEVVEYKSGKVLERIAAGSSASRADKVDRGVNINLDHDRFYTRIAKTP